MIVTFSISNFRSFASEETLSLVASTRLAGIHETHAVAIPASKEQVLKTAILYGANGAGKTNLVKALRFLKDVALKRREKNSGTGHQPFRFGQIEHDASSFDLQFIANDQLFRYGCKLNEQRILEEWLVQIVRNKEKVLYERVSNSDGSVQIEAPGLKGAKLSALATIGGPQNQSFLATIRATLDEADFGEPLRSVVDWFENRLTLINPDAKFNFLASKLAQDPLFLQFAGEFLHSASTGVHGLQVQKKEVLEDELRQILPEEVVNHLLQNLPEGADERVLLPLGNGREILLEHTDRVHYYRVSVQASHQQTNGNVRVLDLADESDGTRRLLDLLPALHEMRNQDAVYVIDEIDRSLHPMLVRKFLECFLQSCHAGLRQIIVTTHESSLLDLELLRRDEIWFAEKDDAAATHLYSLADFKVRNDLEIRKHYMQGRFGAVPFLANLERLVSKDAEAA